MAGRTRVRNAKWSETWTPQITDQHVAHTKKYSTFIIGHQQREWKTYLQNEDSTEYDSKTHEPKHHPLGDHGKSSSNTTDGPAGRHTQSYPPLDTLNKLSPLSCIHQKNQAFISYQFSFMHNGNPSLQVISNSPKIVKQNCNIHGRKLNIVKYIYMYSYAHVIFIYFFWLLYVMCRSPVRGLEHHLLQQSTSLAFITSITKSCTEQHIFPWPL